MIKDYIIKENLGLGSYGTIYKVLKKSNNNIYVIKRISLVGMTQEQIEKAKLESKILSSINSPYIVKYYESFLENDFLNIVMEYCDGGDLNEFIIKHEETHILLKEKVIWNIFLKILIGLSHLHKLKILHRDLKPLNIFLTKNKNLDLDIKIGDFGVAKILKENNFANTLIGTPYYISPELCEELPYNEKSDIWALGCILYELCTYKHPFNAKCQASLVMKILENKPKSINKYYSDDLQKLINLILDKNYKTRPSCEDILKLPFVIEQLKKIGLHDKININTNNINKPKNKTFLTIKNSIYFNNKRIFEKNIGKTNNINKSFNNIKEIKTKKLYNNHHVLHISKSNDNIIKLKEEKNNKNNLIINNKEPKNSYRNNEIKINFLNNIKNTIDAYELKIKKEHEKHLNIKKYYPKYKKPNLTLLDIDNDREMFQNIKTTDILNNEKVDTLIEIKLLKMKKDKKEINIKDFASSLNNNINKIKSVNKQDNYDNTKYEYNYKKIKDKSLDKKIINKNILSFDINKKEKSDIFEEEIIKNIYSNKNIINIEEKKNSMIINKIKNIYKKLKNINIKNLDNKNDL